MEALNNKQKDITQFFLITAQMLLIFGMLFGIFGIFQYIIPGLGKEWISFEKTRPLHVSSVLFWILFGAMGSVLTYLKNYTNNPIRYPFLLKLQWFLFACTTIIILISYLVGQFGGREYWEFNPILSLPLMMGWILFIINFLSSIKSFKNQPVYIWMWVTGLFFFLFTFLESYLWIFPYFRNNIINDMTIQWKSYGSMVGAWNMLIYGSGIYLLEKISGNPKNSRSTISFVLYFTGLTNLMFNWGHHIYTLPTHQYIKHISYIISMSELFIFGRIVYQWKNSLTAAKKQFHIFPYRFLLAADIWVFLSLALAIVMSIPAINVYTHGTHITVAHAMGTTIGINSFLLLACITDIVFTKTTPSLLTRKWIMLGYWISNICLLLFWLNFIMAGIVKARWQIQAIKTSFSVLMTSMHSLFIILSISGTGLIIGLLFILIPLLKSQIQHDKID